MFTGGLAARWELDVFGGISQVNFFQYGKLDPLVVGRAHVVYERGEKPGAIL